MNIVGIPLVEPPRPYENIQGYVLRLSELNLYERPRWIYGMVEDDFSAFSFSGLRKCARELAVLTGVQGEDFQAISYADTGARNHNSVSAGGRFNLSPTLLDIENPKICTDCVLEYGSIASLWDLRAYVVCSRHKCYLTDKCGNPKCGRRLSWWRPYLSRCGKCEEIYRTADWQVEPNEDLLHYSRMIESRWGAAFRSERDCDHVWSEMSDVDFFKLLQVFISRLRKGPAAATRALSPDDLFFRETALLHRLPPCDRLYF